MFIDLPCETFPWSGWRRGDSRCCEEDEFSRASDASGEYPPVVPIISIFEKAFLCGQIINDSQTLIHDALSDQTISSFVPMFHGLTGG